MRRKGIREDRVSKVRRTVSAPDFQIDCRRLAERLLVIAGPLIFCSRGARVSLRWLRAEGSDADQPLAEGPLWLLSGVEKPGPH